MDGIGVFNLTFTSADLLQARLWIVLLVEFVDDWEKAKIYSCSSSTEEQALELCSKLGLGMQNMMDVE